MLDFLEYLNDVRKETLLANLVERCVATEEEKVELEKLAEKNIQAFIYFKNILEKNS